MCPSEASRKQETCARYSACAGTQLPRLGAHESRTGRATDDRIGRAVSSFSRPRDVYVIATEHGRQIPESKAARQEPEECGEGAIEERPAQAAGKFCLEPGQRKKEIAHAQGQSTRPEHSKCDWRGSRSASSHARFTRHFLQCDLAPRVRLGNIRRSTVGSQNADDDPLRRRSPRSFRDGNGLGTPAGDLACAAGRDLRRIGTSSVSGERPGQRQLRLLVSPAPKYDTTGDEEGPSRKSAASTCTLASVPTAATAGSSSVFAATSRGLPLPSTASKSAPTASWSSSSRASGRTAPARSPRARRPRGAPHCCDTSSEVPHVSLLRGPLEPLETPQRSRPNRRGARGSLRCANQGFASPPLSTASPCTFATRGLVDLSSARSAHPLARRWQTSPPARQVLRALATGFLDLTPNTQLFNQTAAADLEASKVSDRSQ